MLVEILKSFSRSERMRGNESRIWWPSLLTFSDIMDGSDLDAPALTKNTPATGCYQQKPGTEMQNLFLLTASQFHQRACLFSEQSNSDTQST